MRLPALAAAVVLAASAGAQAQSYPSKPVTVIVPFAAVAVGRYIWRAG